MSKRKILEDDYYPILNCVALFPQGALLEDIIKSLTVKISRRTLQRRLAVLVEERDLDIAGKARARRYRLPSIRSTYGKDVGILREAADGFELSSLGDDIRMKIRQPLQARMPVGYNRKFLDQYRPNVTNYLPNTILEKLLEMGKTNVEKPAGTYARGIINRLLIDLSWNSSRLEGNTYSLLETERLLKLCEFVEGKDPKEARMILNHKIALEFLLDSSAKIGINRRTVLNLHTLLSYDLMGDSKACGRLRTIPVGIGKSVYQPLSIPYLIEECFQQILDTAQAIKNPFEQAFFLMVHLPYLQPFEDVNKRVSRLAANIPLFLHNLCPLSFVDVPQEAYVNGLLGIYELNRIELLREVFVFAYERSCLRYMVTRIEMGNPDPFRIKYYTQITEIIGNIVRNCMNKTDAIASIRAYADKNIPLLQQERFIEVLEKDLMGMHEGNYAVYRVRFSEYEKWERSWT